MPKYTPFKDPKNMKIKNNSIDFSTSTPMIMGILNISSDSFYDGGKYSDENKIILQTQKMLDEGADVIDVGGQSSKPGAKQIDAKKELSIVLPVIKLLKSRFPDIIISIDTFWSEVAKECVEEGADIINDISAGEIDKNMFNVVRELQVPYIMMHMQGKPENMQNKPQYKDIIKEIKYFFERKISELRHKGFSKIIIDPGLGFGKSITHNYKLINNITSFKELELPVLIGASRKSLIYNVLETEARYALNGTTIINTLALINGANILRVHDVKEAMECIKIIKFAKNNL
tara:strand:+ start:659 stop:1525 length:867 start_codon:yes stop_codon:yes gene_type:complete